MGSDLVLVLVILSVLVKEFDSKLVVESQLVKPLLRVLVLELQYPHPHQNHSLVTEMGSVMAMVMV